MVSEKYQKAKKYAEDMVLLQIPTRFKYHNYDHTARDVIPNILTLASFYDNKGEPIDDENLELLLTAGWFHDLGYVMTSKGHEDAGIYIFNVYNDQQEKPFRYGDKEADAVGGIISATKIPQNPTTLLEQIMSDADVGNLGRKDFFSKGEKLRKETNAVGRYDNPDFKKISRKDWLKGSLSFIRDVHQGFYTEAADRLGWNEQKQRNIEELERKIL